MEVIITAIVGIIAPYITDIFKKLFKLTDSTAMKLTAGVISILLGTVMELLRNPVFSVEDAIQRIGVIFTASQVWYIAIYKGTDLNVRLTPEK